MSTTTEQRPLHLHKLQVSNFMQVTALTIDCDGQHVQLSGPNGSGKTSTLDAIFAALKGLSVRDHPEPVRKGSERASVTLDLGEYMVERHWTAKGSRLVVSASDGSKVREPQALLNGLLSLISLDPVAFLDARPQDQIDQILTVYGVLPPAEQVAALTGEDLPPRPGESADAYLMRLSGDETGLFYVRRREANRITDQKRKALEEQRQVLRGLGGPLSADEKEQSASALLKRIEALQGKHEQRRAVQQEAALARQEHRAMQEKLQERKASHGACLEDAQRIRDQIAHLQVRLNERLAAAGDLATRIERGQAIVAELEAEASAKEEAASKLPDPAPEITELRRQVAGVEETNAQRTRRQAAGEQLDRLAREVEHAQAEHQKLDQVLDGLRGLRVHLLDGVDLGVPGLEVGQGELRLGGVSFRQASTGQQLDVAAEVAMRQRSKLRLLRIDNAERLDRPARERLLRRATERGFQVIMACVAEGEKMRVEVVEGENGDHA